MGELRAEQAKEDSLLPVGPRGGGQSAHGTENREAWGPHSFIGSSIPVLLQYPTVPRRQAVLGAGTMAGMAGSARGSPPGSAHCSPDSGGNGTPEAFGAQSARSATAWA